LYYFAKFAIVNELLTIKDCRISARGRIGPSQSDAGPHKAAVRSCLQTAMAPIAAR